MVCVVRSSSTTPVVANCEVRVVRAGKKLDSTTNEISFRNFYLLKKRYTSLLTGLCSRRPQGSRRR